MTVPAMTTGPVVAPDAPAPWGRPVTAAAMAEYLDRLTAWRDHRRRELDRLDAAALASPSPSPGPSSSAPPSSRGGGTPGPDASVTSDVTLAMALWQTVASRTDELLRTWDGGRVGAAELAALSAAIWGRTHAATASGASASSTASGVSLPEACRLSDAVTAQLRQRLALDAGNADTTAVLTALRAGVERIRDLVRQAPEAERAPAFERLERLDRRLRDTTERAARGADVGGLLGGLQSEAATCERDLIVAAARARDDERDHDRAVAWRSELVGRAAAVTALVDRCVAQVTPAPVLGVPHVAALGEVPQDPAAVDVYLERLGAVARALDQVERAYGAPLAELADLEGLLQGTGAQAAARGRAALPEVAALARVAAELVAERPVELLRLRAVVAAYRVLLETPAPPPPSTAGRRS